MVKCSECGFLAVRTSPNIGEVPYLAEMHEGHRREARISERNVYYPKPVCFMRVAWFREQMDEVPNDAYPDLSPVIHADHPCDEFTEWHQGFSPKEHREMLDRQFLFDAEERRRKEDKAWRRTELVVLGVIAVVVAGGFTILGAFIQRGSIP